MKSGMEGTLKVVAIAMAACVSPSKRGEVERSDWTDFVFPSVLVVHLTHRPDSLSTRRHRSVYRYRSVFSLAFRLAHSNFFMFLLKAWAAYHSGSSAMVSEALHSLADSLNQCLLAWGIYRSMQTPDPEHPYGFQSERYAWALVSGVGIFFLGGGVSIQHGIHGLMHPEPLGHVGTAVGVLIANFAVDGYSMKTAYKEIKEKAGEQGLKPMEYLRKGGDPTTSAVFYEDLAALSGVVIALGALGMSHVTASPFWDSVGSITIGGVLAWVAVNLIKKNIDGLVGTSMAPRKLNAIVEAIKKDPVVISVHDVKTVARGSTWARFKAEINFDGAQIVRRYRERLAMTSSQLPAEAVQQLNFGVLRKDDGFESEEECQRWLEAHGRGILEQVGLEIDRVEKIVFEMAPEVSRSERSERDKAGLADLIGFPLFALGFTGQARRHRGSLISSVESFPVSRESCFSRLPF